MKNNLCIRIEVLDKNRKPIQFKNEYDETMTRVKMEDVIVAAIYKVIKKAGVVRIGNSR